MFQSPLCHDLSSFFSFFSFFKIELPLWLKLVENKKQLPRTVKREQWSDFTCRDKANDGLKVPIWCLDCRQLPVPPGGIDSLVVRPSSSSVFVHFTCLCRIIIGCVISIQCYYIAHRLYTGHEFFEYWLSPFLTQLWFFASQVFHAWGL